MAYTNTGSYNKNRNGSNNERHDNNRPFKGKNQVKGKSGNGYKNTYDRNSRSFNKNGNFNKGKKKPFNKGGKFSHKSYDDKLIFLKWANPRQFIHETCSLMDSGSGIITADDEKKAIGNIFHQYHLYKVYISSSNRFVSGWSYMKVGFLAFHEEIGRVKTNLSSITMSFVPVENLEFDEDTLNKIELATYIAGKNLMQIYSKAVNFSMPKLVAAGLANEIKKAGFTPCQYHISTIYGTIIEPTVYSAFTAYKGGTSVKLNIKSDTDIFIKNYADTKFISKSIVEFDKNSMILKDAVTKQPLAKIHKLEFGTNSNGKKTRVIKYEILGKNPKLGKAVEDFIKNGIKNENKSHKSPFDPIEKIEFKDVTTR